MTVSEKPLAAQIKGNSEKAFVSPEPDRRAMTPWQPGSVLPPRPCLAAKVTGPLGTPEPTSFMFHLDFFGLPKNSKAGAQMRVQERPRGKAPVTFHAAVPLTERHLTKAPPGPGGSPMGSGHM